MQTFLPYPSFAQSAKCLDSRRLGKQRVETLQLLKALTEPAYGWQNHPATRMWRGYVPALASYGVTICNEWLSRGYRDTCRDKIAQYIVGDCSLPPSPGASQADWTQYGDDVIRRLRPGSELPLETCVFNAQTLAHRHQVEACLRAAFKAARETPSEVLLIAPDPAVLWPATQRVLATLPAAACFIRGHSAYAPVRHRSAKRGDETGRALHSAVASTSTNAIRHTSVPESSGSMRSRTTRSGASRAWRSTAAGPSAASSTA